MSQNTGKLVPISIKHASVDTVLEHSGALYPIEVKMKANLTSKDASEFKAFRDCYEGTIPVKTALIIYTDAECYWFDKKIQ
ncbi:MAG: hypothetical protein QG632_90 [Candidatus Dependentiae bacterium]|nr:hypothetical protein [Candidatus Dependentiae bacterium]